MKISLPFLGFFVALLLTPITRADEAADKARIRELEKASADALVNANFPMLKEIFAESWILVGQDGSIGTRAEVFKELSSADLKFSSYELGDMEIRIYGDTAVVAGHGNPRGSFRGEKFEEKEAFSDTFIRMDGKWRCVLSHAAAMPDTK